VSISDSSCEEQADTGGGKDVKEVRGEEEKKEEVNVKKKVKVEEEGEEEEGEGEGEKTIFMRDR